MVNGYRVVHGERPPINHDLVPADAMEEGILLLKFYRHMETHLEANPPTTDRDGIVRFNMTAPDTLNARYSVHEINQYFRSPALRNTFTDRHKAWGFHLWYELRVDETTDIVRMMEAYRQLPEVEIAEPVFRKRLIDGVTDTGETASEILLTTIRDTWTPNDPDFSYQWHYHNTGQSGGTVGADISMPQAWAREKGHEDVIVAIIDDGIQYNHPDLAGNMWQDAVHPDGGYNFVDNNTTIIPGNHGTHVAGTVAAVSNNNIGVAGVAGGSGSGDGVRLMSAQVFRAQNNTQGGFHIAPIWAADQGAAISQNSWGYIDPNTYNQNVLDAIDYFNTYGGGNVMEGGITIFAAGNSDSDQNWYPAYYSGAMAVAATNNQDIRSYYSNHGSWIDISAPGGETNTVLERGVLSTVTNNNYEYFQGTSMACPHVSGAAALLISKAHRNNFSLINDAVWDLLVDYTDDHYGVNQDFINELGSGRLNADASLEALATMLDGIPNPIDFTAVAVGTDQINLSWSLNAESHDVMIAWSDENSFGIPVTGTTYQVGEFLPGNEGSILYLGDQTSFEHVNLEINTNYYYKAFSVDEGKSYSRGVVAFSRTQSANLLVNGLNKQYTSFPPSQLPEEMVLQAHVKNTGTDLEESVEFNFTVNGDDFSATTILADPLPAGTETTITAEDAWVTAALSTGTYTIQYDADHTPSKELDRKDSFAFYVSENNIYARDHGLTRGGVGANARSLFAMRYNVLQPAVFTTFQVLWPTLPDTGTLDFEFALYEVNDQQGVLQTLISGEQFTRDGNTMSGALAEFYLENPVVLELGHYMVAIRQLTGENISLGYDARKWGYFYIANDADDPDSFSKNADFGNLTLRMVLDDITLTTWTGTTDNDWHTTTNWSDGIPGELSQAVIPSDAPVFPTIDSPAEVQNLTMESGSSLIDNENLTIHGEFTMERYIEAAGGWGEGSSATDWHFIASPVGNQSIDNSWTPSGINGGYDFYAYQEDPPLWLNQKQEGNNITHFIPGKGYLVAYENSGNRYFEGQPGTGDIGVTLSRLGDGWNLLGNPYPSAIDWNKVSQHTNHFEDVYAYIYDRNKSGGAGYATIDGSEAEAWIPANQGFFVKAKEDNVTFTFSNGLRDHGDSFMKEEPWPSGEVHLVLSGDHYHDEATLRVRENAAHQRDPLDALKLFSFDENIPQLYTLTRDAVKTAINSIPHIDENTPVSIGMRIPEKGTYTLSAEVFGEPFVSHPIYIEDKKENTSQNLQDQPIYQFQADKGEITERFLLYFSSSLLAESMESDIRAWYHDNTLYVISEHEDTRIIIYDYTGRQLRIYHAGKGKKEFLPGLGPGAYIAEIRTEEEITSTRFIVY